MPTTTFDKIKPGERLTLDVEIDPGVYRQTTLRVTAVESDDITAPTICGGEEVYYIFVEGKAEPKGSTRAFYVPKLGRAVITSDNPKVKAWEKAIRVTWVEMMRRQGLGVHHAGGPFRLETLVVLKRIKSLKKRGPTPPHITRSDIDKMLRSVGDALTGVVWNDDSQIIDIRSRKRYAEPGETPGAHIWVEAVSTL